MVSRTAKSSYSGHAFTPGGSCPIPGSCKPEFALHARVQMTESPGSPASSLVAPNVWGSHSDGSVPPEEAAAPAREPKRSRLLQNSAADAAASTAAGARDAAAVEAPAVEPADQSFHYQTEAEAGGATPAGRQGPSAAESTAALRTLEVRMVPSDPTLVEIEFQLYR